MLTVVVARPPRFGGKVASVDAKAALGEPGVVDVKPIPSGVAVYAQGMYPAMQGPRRLKVTWDDTGAEKRGTDAADRGVPRARAQAGRGRGTAW